MRVEWNDPEPIVCRECDGEGILEADLNVRGIVCADCEGTGIIESRWSA